MTIEVSVSPIWNLAVVCGGKVALGPAEHPPCQAPTKAPAFQLLLLPGFPAAQPGGWMCSPLLGARTDSCVRQNPDCRACSIKLPVRPLQSPAKRLPWRHDGPRSGHPAWRGAQEGRPGRSRPHPDVWEDQEREKGRRQRPPHCVEMPGRGSGGRQEPTAWSPPHTLAWDPPCPPPKCAGFPHLCPASQVTRVPDFLLSLHKSEYFQRIFLFPTHKDLGCTQIILCLRGT